MTRVLSSNSLRTSKDFRLIPLGIAENVNGGGELKATVQITGVNLTVVAECEFCEGPTGGS